MHQLQEVLYWWRIFMDLKTSTHPVVMSFSQTANQCQPQGSTLFIYPLMFFFSMSSMHVRIIYKIQFPSCPRVNSLQHWNCPSIQYRVACRALLLMLNGCYSCQHVCFIDFQINVGSQSWQKRRKNILLPIHRRLTHSGEAVTTKWAAIIGVLQIFVQQSHSNFFSSHNYHKLIIVKLNN